MNIKELRTSKGYTQEKIAEALGINQTAVAMWETGKALPPADKIIRISEILGVCTEKVIRSFPKYQNEHECLSDWKCMGRCLNCPHSSISPESTEAPSWTLDLLGELERFIKNGWSVDDCFEVYTSDVDGNLKSNPEYGRKMYAEAIRTAINILSKEIK